VVMCSGEAGIGKTRLLEGLLGCGGIRGAQVLWARSLAPASAPPYWLWEQLFGPRRGRILAAAVVRLAQIRKGRRRCPICCPERDYRPSVR
jgi:hypothetical protein